MAGSNPSRRRTPSTVENGRPKAGAASRVVYRASVTSRVVLASDKAPISKVVPHSAGPLTSVKIIFVLLLAKQEL
jgi:hypothetical protein